MVGPVTPNEPFGTEPVADIEPRRGVAGFLSTTIGKIVAGGLVVFVIVGILGAIGFFFFTSRLTEQIEVVVTQTPPAATSTTETAAPQQRPSPKLENAFTFRNIFSPSVKPAVPASPTADTTGTAGGVDVPPNTLYLQDVITVDGEEVAVLAWNGQTYQAGDGDRLGDTPWQVLSIDGDTVVMLYGDSRVTLTVGQAVGK